MGRYLGSLRDAVTAWYFHFQYGHAGWLCLVVQFNQLFKIMLQIVELGATHYHCFAGQPAGMKIRNCKGDTISADQQVGLLEKWRMWRH